MGNNAGLKPDVPDDRSGLVHMWKKRSGKQMILMLSTSHPGNLADVLTANYLDITRHRLTSEGKRFIFAFSLFLPFLGVALIFAGIASRIAENNWPHFSELLIFWQNHELLVHSHRDNYWLDTDFSLVRCLVPDSLKVDV